MKLIVGNWKMNGHLNLLQECLKQWQGKHSSNQVIICLPSVFLEKAHTFIHQANFYIGGQDCHSQLQGAFTGDTSAAHLQEVGCQYVLVGHSERRQGHQETNSLVKSKAEAALKADLMPIICIGETLEQREQGITLKVIRQQLEESVPNQSSSPIIAYEPVWAIGTGKVSALEDIQNVHIFIKRFFNDQVKILYGGSVTVDNYKEILSLPEVDGILVGGASLKADDFSKMIHYEFTS
jgi:triosephosphate isomerase